jgi:hypothetical protein
MSKTNATEGLPWGSVIEISRTNGATEKEGIEAFLTDLKRRYSAGELVSLNVIAEDHQGNTLKYDSRRAA